jgi:beta-glucuronidase
MEDPEIAGVSLWQFCDCRTFASSRALGRPRTFNNKGTFDEYRRPKQAAQVVRRWFRDAD